MNQMRPTLRRPAASDEVAQLIISQNAPRILDPGFFPENLRENPRPPSYGRARSIVPRTPPVPQLPKVEVLTYIT